MESVQDMSGCGDDQKVKYTAGSFVGQALTWEEFCPINEMHKVEIEFWNHAMVEVGHAVYTNRFHEVARLVPHLVTPKNRRIERIGSLKRNPVRRGNGGEPSRDKNVKDDNKRTRTGNAFATTANPDCRAVPRVVNLVNARNLTAAHGACFEYGGTDHFKATCPRLNQAQRPGGNHPNQAVANNGGQVVRIPLQKGKVLRVLGERPKEKVRQLMSAKAKEQKQEKIIVVRNFPEVFPDDLSGLLPTLEIEFPIELILGAIPIAKSPYRLASSEMEELSGQIREL
ncbi:hypothetical protein Tco_0911550 [Tanacetum coccineum]|uniref:Reverse transcriptase domain-containing protein n=1 Tax=Tanacetum coccineum TaxID=301880 RepID=A0ABQ5CW33_9ASTR